MSIQDRQGNYQKYNTDGTTPVSITGSLVNRRGLAINKPSANTVEVGTTYWSVDTDPHGDFIEVSDGTNWVVM